MASRFLKLEKSELSFKLPSFLLHDKKDHCSSNNEKASLDNCNLTKILQIRIFHLLKSHPKGIQIERFNKEYQMKYYEDLITSDYGFDDLVDLLKSFSQIVSIAVEGKYNEIILYAKNVIEDHDLNQETDLVYNENGNLNLEIKRNEKKLVKSNLQENYKKINIEELPASAKLPSKVLNVFNTILDSHDGGIDIDFLSSEYKYRTGKELKPSCWGFNSIIDMLSKLSDVFTICKLPNGKFILCTASKTKTLSKNNDIHKHSKENSLSCASVSLSVSDRDEDVKFNRKLPSLAQKRLRSLFEDYFPNGLEINEIVGAYRGFYGATLDDLNPIDYGYLSLEAFLRAHKDLLNVQSYGNTIHKDLLNVQAYGNTIMVFPSRYMKDVSSFNIEFPLPACCVVSLNESYTTYDYDVFMKNAKVDFVIGEVYSPSKFHVMHQGEKSSQALNALMDQMFEFYDSPISKRYEVKKESMLSRTHVPVVARYSEDLNWYRAIIISISNIYVAKLFLVDYGTTCSCSYTDLRLLHQNFFMLPAQAIRASLYGIRPSKDNKSWSKPSTKTFKDLVQNKYFHSRVHDVSDGLIISLCDDNNVIINELLVAKGYASFKDGHFPIDFGSSVEKITTICTSENIEIAKDDANFNIKEHQDTKELQVNSMSDRSYNIDTNDKEIREDKVTSWLSDLEANIPLERINENMNNFSTVSYEGLKDNNPTNTEVPHHNTSADVDHLDFSNIVSRNNRQCSVILEDGAQSIIESLKKRKVEVMKIKDQSIHIIYLSGERYMLSSEISRFIWGSDELQDQLKRMEIVVPYINLQHATHADIFKQLSSYGVKDILGANNQVLMTVTIYPLDTAFKILSIFKYKDLETMAIIKNLSVEATNTDTIVLPNGKLEPSDETKSDEMEKAHEKDTEMIHTPHTLKSDSILKKCRLVDLKKSTISVADLKKSDNIDVKDISKISKPLCLEYSIPFLCHAYLIGKKRRHVTEMEKKFYVQICFPHEDRKSSQVSITGFLSDINKVIQYIKMKSGHDPIREIVKVKHGIWDFKVDLVTYNKIVNDLKFPELRENLNVNIEIVPNTHSNYSVIIEGKLEMVDKAKLAILEFLTHISEMLKKMKNIHRKGLLLLTDVITIPFVHHGRLIGGNGSNVKTLQSKYSVEIHIPAKFLHSNKVFIRGTKLDIGIAKAAIFDFVKSINKT